jgi:hypothetical protein
MDDRTSRFFKWVWRIDGLLLMACALGALAIIGLVLGLEVFGPQRVPDALTEVAGQALEKSDLRLSGFQPISGTSFLYAPLEVRGEYGLRSGSSGYGYGEPRNLLFFDALSKRAHWLLESSDRTIHSYAFLTDPADSADDEDDDERHTIGLLLEIARDPASSERKASALRRVAVAAPDGRTIATIAETAQEVLGHHQPRTDTLLVFYVADGVARVLDVDPTTRTVRSDSVLE